MRQDIRQLYQKQYYNSSTYYRGSTISGTYSYAYNKTYYAGSTTNYRYKYDKTYYAGSSANTYAYKYNKTYYVGTTASTYGYRYNKTYYGGSLYMYNYRYDKTYMTYTAPYYFIQQYYYRLIWYSYRAATFLGEGGYARVYEVDVNGTSTTYYRFSTSNNDWSDGFTGTTYLNTGYRYIKTLAYNIRGWYNMNRNRFEPSSGYAQDFITELTDTYLDGTYYDSIRINYYNYYRYSYGYYAYYYHYYKYSYIATYKSYYGYYRYSYAATYKMYYGYYRYSYVSSYTRYYGYYKYSYANYKYYYGYYYYGPFTSNYYTYTRSYLYK